MWEERYDTLHAMSDARRRDLVEQVAARLLLEKRVAELERELAKAHEAGFATSAELERLRGSVCGWAGNPLCGECIKCMRLERDKHDVRADAAEVRARKLREALEEIDGIAWLASEALRTSALTKHGPDKATCDNPLCRIATRARAAVESQPQSPEPVAHTGPTFAELAERAGVPPTTGLASGESPPASTTEKP